MYHYTKPIHSLKSPATSVLPRLSARYVDLQVTCDSDDMSTTAHSEAGATAFDSITPSSFMIESKAKWISSFINLLPDPVALLNKEGEIVYMNSRFHSITNVPLTNGPFNCSLLDLLHDRDKADVLAGLHKSFALKDIVDLAKIRCYSYYDRETHSFPIECSLVLSSSEQENMVLLVMKRLSFLLTFVKHLADFSLLLYFSI